MKNFVQNYIGYLQNNFAKKFFFRLNKFQNKFSSDIEKSQKHNFSFIYKMDKMKKIAEANN